MTKKRAWTDLKRIPTKLVPVEFQEDGRYRPGAGFHCTKSGCGFISKKRGFSGRQALRAHLKVHKRFGRAWRRPLIWQLVWTAVSFSVYSVSAFADLHMPGLLPEEELLSQGDVSSKEIMTAVPALMTMLIVAALLRSVSPTRFPTPSRARLLLVGSVSATFLLAAPAAWQLGLTYRPFHPAIPWLLWAIGLSGLWLAPARGLMRLSLARRNRRPAEYAELLKPKDVEARIDLGGWIRAQVRILDMLRRQRESPAQPSRNTEHRLSRRGVVNQGRLSKPMRDRR